jgi:hypothetical protein
MRLVLGLAAFCAPIILVLTAMAEPSSANTILLVVDEVAAATKR